ncbi:MAG: GFA family protein [Alphaproteobacteria bacterium]|nr:GFA family protein [Alphaproteobacteria bacterium]
MSDPIDTRRGSCLCGAVRFETRGAPMFSGMCYCLNCQKTSGAGRVFHAMFADAQMTIAGETRSFSYSADSGSTVTNVVCAACGSPLFGRNARMPGMTAVRVAAYDGETGLSPAMEV